MFLYSPEKHEFHEVFRFQNTQMQREILFSSRVLTAWHKMYTQLQTAAFASHKGLVEILQGRG